MKSVDFTVQRLLGSDRNAKLQQYGAQTPSTGDPNVTSDDVNDDVIDDEGSFSAGAPRDADLPARPRLEDGCSVEPPPPRLLLHPTSLYLDYARQFLWQLTAAHRPGVFAHLLT